MLLFTTTAVRIILSQIANTLVKTKIRQSIPLKLSTSLINLKKKTYLNICKSIFSQTKITVKSVDALASTVSSDSLLQTLHHLDLDFEAKFQVDASEFQKFP